LKDILNSYNNYFGFKVFAIFISIIISAKLLAAHINDEYSTENYANWNDDENWYENDQDTIGNKAKNAYDSLKFPIPQSPTLDPEQYFGSEHPLYLKDPSNISKTTIYNEDDSTYYISEQVGDKILRTSPGIKAEDYYKYKTQADEQSYFQQRLASLGMFDKKPDMPVMYKEGLLNRLFGSNKMSVTPQGRLELTFGYKHTNNKNPNLQERARKYGSPDFDMDMNMNLLAEVGDKLKLNINQNTRPTFGEQQQQKIEFTGKEDDVLKKIELGNVNFPLNSGLISGVQSLYGVKTQLQFGRLWLTGALSSQKSQRKTMAVQGGGQKTEFSIKIDDYDENRNFLLSQYFYNNYERALEKIPVINSQVLLNRVEVWVTNRQGATQNVRDVLAFMDLGEKNPYQSFLASGGPDLPDNGSNRLYELIQQNPMSRVQSSASQAALALGLKESQDFHRVTMRKLNESEYTFHPQLGFISLNSSINPDDVVAVAYRYTYKGETYQVGDFSSDVSPDSTASKVIFLKMMKGTAARPGLPIWNLMMKNVYSLGYGRMSKEDFRLNVVYLDPGGGRKRYLPEGPQAGVPIIKLLNLDNLNQQNDPIPDGLFDYVEGLTILPQNGKIIFPVLEPFGDGLKPHLGGSPQLERRYLFEMLYDSTKTIARQFQQNNRFMIDGSYKGDGGADISLGYNIPQGSVKVSAGGQMLVEGTDYQVDYSVGRLKILNTAILTSGVPINISYEDNANFGVIPQTFMGLRADYFYNKKFNFGGTLMRLSERPSTNTVQYGYDPIKNTVAGLDASYQTEFMGLTRALDKLPFYSTSAPSLFEAKAEVAGIFPGHHKFIDILDPEGSIALDNFEGANSSIDVRFPLSQWALASVPNGAKDGNGNILFPESANQNDLSYGFNRAKLSWYTVDQTLMERNSAPAHLLQDDKYEAYWRIIKPLEIFPDKQVTAQNNIQSTLDLSYFPHKRGPYNFSTENIDPNSGYFTNPRSKFGGLMRALDNNSSDFEQANVEYITFWVMDPFIYNNNSTGGDLYINLGNVSEDILKDGRISFENGIPAPEKDITKLQETTWGYVPTFSQQLTRVFDASVESRKIQDVGLDEMNDEEERNKFSSFLNRMAGIVSPAVFEKLQEDPASDNFKPYRSAEHDNLQNGIISRYENINNPDGNSQIDNAAGATMGTISSLPESEDLNKDNSLNESESYFQYRVRLMPNSHPTMQVGQNNIVNRRDAVIKLRNGNEEVHTWYQFKIPIRAYDQAVGNISDFRSIRFMRMFLSDFQDSVTLRFAQLQFDRSQWRTYLYSLDKPGEQIPINDTLNTSFAVTTVSVEQNSSKQPVGYKVPPGVVRQRYNAGATGVALQDDERSMAYQICDLKDGDARAAFKELSMDLRQFDYLRLFVHGESVPGQPSVSDNELEVFVRFGSDFVSNYYEYRIPLKITAPGEQNADYIWPEENRINLDLSKVVDMKNSRNAAGLSSFIPYQQYDEKGNPMIVLGNPNLGEVRSIMLGVLNPKRDDTRPTDDGLPKCAEVWFDELRVAGMNEKPGYAASAQANVQLADLGSFHLGGSIHTVGYGSIDQKLNNRFRDNFYNFDINTNLNFGKLLPSNWGVQLPIYVGYIENVSNPEYDPYDLDVKFKDKLQMYSGEDRDSIRKAAQTYTSITSLSLNNIRILGKPNTTGRAKPWSSKNFDLSYNFNHTFNRTPILESDIYQTQRLVLGYNYETGAKSYEPFKKLIKSKSPWLALIRDINLKPLPSTVGFNNNLYKIFGETIIRNIDNDPYEMEPLYIQNFLWDRTYTLRWDLTKSISVNYTGLNQSRVDQPYGRIETQEQKDSLWNSISKFGRNAYYNQSINTSYKVPTSKLPLLSWTNLNLSYNTTYNWKAASLVAPELGNVIANTQTKQINGELIFSQLYTRSRHIKAATNYNDIKGDINQTPYRKALLQSKDTTKANAAVKATPKKEEKAVVPPRPEKKEILKSSVPGKDTLSASVIDSVWRQMKKTEKKRFKAALKDWRAKKKRIMPDMSDGAKYAIRLGTMLKRISVNYTENNGTILPGYTDTSKFFGSQIGGNNWYDFAFGYQPTMAWLERKAVNGAITRDSIFNNQLRQSYTQNIDIKGYLEPIAHMRIDFDLNRNFNKEYVETYKYNYDNDQFEHLSPYNTGSFSSSFIGLGSFFGNSKENYKTFMDNRTVISRRLGNANPYTNGVSDPRNNSYAKGYTEYSQDVLIPSFLAAYSGRDAKKIPLMNNNDESVKANPFKNFFPMPNWRITYNGLSKLKSLQGKVKSITISSSYKGSLNMNSFTSNLNYDDLFGVGFPSFIDSNTNNYVPFFQVPNVSIQENFGPLGKIDISLMSGLTFSLSYNRSRLTSLSLIDYQISETKSEDIVLGFGHRLKGVVLPFSFFGITRLENDLNVKIDMAYRNDITTNTYFVGNNEIPTRGQKVITITPRVEYMVNDNIQLIGYYERRQTIPYVMNTFPMTNTRFGIKLIYLFSQ
jgi:cell surface protein SprA